MYIQYAWKSYGASNSKLRLFSSNIFASVRSAAYFADRRRISLLRRCASSNPSWASSKRNTSNASDSADGSDRSRLNALSTSVCISIEPSFKVGPQTEVCDPLAVYARPVAGCFILLVSAGFEIVYWLYDF